MMQRWSKRLTEVLHANLRRGALFLLGTFIAIMMVMTPLMARPAQAQGIGDLLSLGGSFTNGLSSCAIETVGWVICPTMRSIAKLADYGFSYMNQNFLRVDYAIASNDSGTYKAWEVMRTIANAAFVVAFMVLVYSQISGKGSGGYSIKRLLPRLIIAAIAVNVSYFLCVILIDISNIIGDSLISILVGIADRVGNTIMPIGKQGSAYQDGTLTTITAAVMQKAGVAWVLLTPVAAVIISVATISAAMLLVLIMRKTVIAMLILVSPILFVAYLLPNLERFFTQGVRLFLQLLLLYPIIALLLGAGQIVSATIVSVGTNDANYRVSNDGYLSRNGGSGSAIVDSTAAAAAVLPLLGVWFLFKNMSSIMSTAGSRLTAAVKGRRGGSDDKEARVTGKATMGAQNIKKIYGGENPNRRQAYSHKRRRGSPGGSVLTSGSITASGDESNKPKTTNQPQPTPSQNLFGEPLSSDIDVVTGEEESKQRDKQESASLNADAKGLDLGSPVGEGDENTENNENNESNNFGKDVAKKERQEQSTAKENTKENVKEIIGNNEQENHVTAKDLFSQLNRKQGHQSKDSERKFSAGAPAAGNGGSSGGGATGGSVQPSAPVVGYKAPQIAQNENIVSGSSAPQQSTPVVAIPVQVDTSSLLGQNSMQQPPDNMTQPPISGTEEKAKARAQKYIFDAERDLDEARNRQDILGHKELDEQEKNEDKDGE